MGEFDIIRRLIDIGWKSRSDIVVGPGDDAAVLAEGLLISTDISVEGVHFKRSWLSLEEVGFRAASAALSDIAAMGGTAIALLVSIVVPEEASAGAVEIQTGVARAGVRVSAPVIGGDLSRGDQVVVDVTVLGRCSAPVLRSGACPGDDLWVSGSLGGAALAVRAWTAGGEPTSHQRQRFVCPPDRSTLGQRLSEGLASAMIDVSDGLIADAGHLADQSKVRVVIDSRIVPVHGESVGVETDSLKLALEGGEDYELLFTARPRFRNRIEAVSKVLGLPLIRVGVVEEGQGTMVENEDGRISVRRGGHDHFA